MSEETKDGASAIAKALRKAFKDITIDLRKPFPISSAIIQQKATDFNSGRVKFPIIVLGIYGAGVNAVVLKIQDSQQEIYAMRVGFVDKKMIDLQQKLSKYEMAPNVFYVGGIAGRAQSFTIMDRISATLDSYLKNASIDPQKLIIGIKCLLDKKTLLDFLHGDMHTENIAILKDGSTLGFIDFEFSAIIGTPALTTLDFIPFLGNLKRVVASSQPPRRAHLQQLRTLIVSYYRETFNMSIKQYEVASRKGGGYEYHGLTSYFGEEAFKESEVSVARKFYSVFSNFSMPKIVP